MARLAGVDLPRDKRVEIGLTYIYGIGRTTSNKILAEAGVNPDTRVRDLTDEEVGKIKDVSSVCRKSDATEASVTEKVCRSAARTRRTTPVRAKDRGVRLRTRRSK